MTMEISVWGARGSLPTGDQLNIHAGCNTSCVMVRTGTHVVIFDAGSGISGLGQHLLDIQTDCIDIFLSHPHYDHLIGLPFFTPLFQQGRKIRIWSADDHGENGTEGLIKAFMRPPFFPISTDVFAADISYQTLERGRTIHPLDGISLSTCSLNHPGGNTGYRINKDGRSFCYISDFEHDEGPQDQALCEFINSTDLAFLDATFTPEEYEKYKGFGHAHWRAAGEICQRANVTSWCLFHHGHLRSDEDLDAIEHAAAMEYPGTKAAREGDVFVI